MTIVYSFNDGYAMQAGISILSLLHNNRDIIDIKIVIIDDNINAQNKEKLEQIASGYQRKIHFLDLEGIVNKLTISTSFHRCSYARLFLADKLADDVVCYFDSDTIICGSIAQLFDTDMSNYYVAGVQDTVNPAYLTGIGLTHNEKYINAGGVIILNLKKWRENDVEEQCLSFIVKHKGAPPHNDQGTINYVCRGKKLILAPQYNLMNPMLAFQTKQLRRLFKMIRYYSQVEIDYAKDNPIVIHYTEELFNRPWFANSTHPLKDIFIKYLRMSPWAGYVVIEKSLSKNAYIQNFIFRHTPFCIYQLMVRVIEIKHGIRKALKK